jgi:hypothetical protein
MTKQSVCRARCINILPLSRFPNIAEKGDTCQRTQQAPSECRICLLLGSFHHVCCCCCFFCFYFLFFQLRHSPFPRKTSTSTDTSNGFRFHFPRPEMDTDVSPSVPRIRWRDRVVWAPLLSIRRRKRLGEVLAISPASAIWAVAGALSVNMGMVAKKRTRDRRVSGHPRLDFMLE